ncbi:MAG TPA: hypothetical protein VGP26_05130 [Actinophytocola sp.]|nr:hypothetical protein [Actinophytocola sp.]
MFVSDGGGGAAPAGPTFTGTQRLHIEPASIPTALSAFREAHDRISRKVEELSGLPVNNWAGDPVSGETAKQFTERTNGGGADSAMACLTGYQTQLEAAIDSLEKSQAEYLAIEGTNTARWGKYE